MRGNRPCEKVTNSFSLDFFLLERQRLSKRDSPHIVFPTYSITESFIIPNSIKMALDHLPEHWYNQSTTAPPPMEEYDCTRTSDDSFSALSSDESTMSLAEKSIPWFSSDESTSSHSDASTLSISSGNATALRVQELLSDKREMQREIDELKATVDKRDETILWLQQDKMRTAAKHFAELTILQNAYANEVQQ